MKNLKYVLLIWSFISIGFALWQLNSAFTPKVGPIGTGSNVTAIWTIFSLTMIVGIATLGLAIYLFKTDNKNQSDRESNQPSPKDLTTISILCGLMAFMSSITAIFSPHIFVRTINMISIIALSMAIGAFIREIFIMKAKQNRNENDV